MALNNCYWIFQSNPNYFDIVGAINEYQTMYFTVSRYKNEIKPGDNVFMWASGKDAGIYGLAKVINEPYKQEFLPPIDPFYINGRDENRSKVVVDIKIEKVLEPPILKKQLKEYQELEDLLIIKFPQGTNFRVNEPQGDLIMKIIGDG